MTLLRLVGRTVPSSYLTTLIQSLCDDLACLLRLHSNPVDYCSDTAWLANWLRTLLNAIGAQERKVAVFLDDIDKVLAPGKAPWLPKTLPR